MLESSFGETRKYRDIDVLLVRIFDKSTETTDIWRQKVENLHLIEFSPKLQKSGRIYAYMYIYIPCKNLVQNYRNYILLDTYI